MAYRGKDTKEDLNYNEERIPLTSGEAGYQGDSENSESVSPGDGEDESVEESPLVSHIVDMDKGECMHHISSLHEDVEKLFEATPKFDINLLSGPETVLSDRAIQDKEEETPVVSVHRRPSEPLLPTFRRGSFPHAHQPLRAIRSRSSKNIKDQDGKKPHRKHKKKRKLHASKSFPSKDATLSPTIEETEEQVSENFKKCVVLKDYDEDSDEDESSSGSESESESEEEQVDTIDGSSSSVLPPDQVMVSRTVSESSGSPDKVGFYIGDIERQLSEGSTSKQNSLTDSSRRPSAIEPLEESSNPLFYLANEEPVLSQRAAATGATILHRWSTQGMGQYSWQAFYWDSLHPYTQRCSILIDCFRSESHAQRQKHRHHHHDRFKPIDLSQRRHRGSDVALSEQLKRVPTEQEEAMMLHKADLDDMASHRFEDVRGLRRHKINKHNAMASIVHIGKSGKKKKKIAKPHTYDHSPHEVFVELDELFMGEHEEWEWREKARWIKFEEDVEEGAERWGKPHVASLSFHSLIELRKGLETGTLLLDLDASDLPAIAHHVVESMIIHDQIRADQKGSVLRVLLLKHKHQKEPISIVKTLSSANFPTFASQTASSANLQSLEQMHAEPQGNNSTTNRVTMTRKMSEGKKIEFVKVDVDSKTKADGVHIGITTKEGRQKQTQDIMRRIPVGAEAITVLVGGVDFLEKPIMAFVRLAEGCQLSNLTEVPLPVRFVFILLGPEKAEMDYHEVGRSLSTLMSNQHFHDVAYRAESRAELLHAINEFLNESIVLPPGEWDQKTLLPIMDMARKRANMRRRKKQKEDEKKALLEKQEKDKIPLDPLKRTGRLFGGLINDIRRRYPHYLSDYTDALSMQCLAAFTFIFFACLSPCIAFGGLIGESTEGEMGVTETVLSTSICGIVFGLFSGQPVMLIGASGPVLVFEKSLFKFCKSSYIEFLPWRVWTGMWVVIISTVVCALEGSFLVKYVTRFTEEIFDILISIIFIYEVYKKLIETFTNHPILPNYCEFCTIKGMSNGVLNSTQSNTSVIERKNSSIPNETLTCPVFLPGDMDRNQPNTALLSSILIFGTFLVAYFLRVFRNSKFLGRSARRALGDFGILLAIVLMVLLDHLSGDIHTQKLDIPEHFGPTSPHKRGWFINPMGHKQQTEIWQIFAAIIPGFLLFMLLFLETQITEMMLNKKESKLKKGSGYHLDQMLVGLFTLLCAFFGLPWMCAATVRTIAHWEALCVMSRTHAPGEKPKLVEVKDQRVTSIVMCILIGVSLSWGPVLRAIPLAVLFGVFLYLGISSMSGLQLFERTKLLFIPVKHHPPSGFVRRVRSFKMNIFTVLQIIFLVLLWIVKSTSAFFAFPFFVMLLIPIRFKLLPFIFSEKELHELDNEEVDSDVEDEMDPDFYRRAHMPV
ncbi:hypothetical protein ScPMuIL_017115 [Solemya velum]